MRPLRRQSAQYRGLRKAGVFWVGGDEAGNFQQMQIAPAARSRRRGRRAIVAAAHPAGRPIPPVAARNR